MRTIAIVLMLGLTGCAASLWPPEFSFGGAAVKSDCKRDGHCTRVTESQRVGAEVLDFVLMILDAVPMVEMGDASVQRQAAAPTVIYVHPTPPDDDDITMDDSNNTEGLASDHITYQSYPPRGHGSTLGWLDGDPTVIGEDEFEDD